MANHPALHLSPDLDMGNQTIRDKLDYGFALMEWYQIEGKPLSHEHGVGIVDGFKVTHEARGLSAMAVAHGVKDFCLYAIKSQQD
jgi:hypothetical protein